MINQTDIYMEIYENIKTLYPTRLVETKGVYRFDCKFIMNIQFKPETMIDEIKHLLDFYSSYNPIFNFEFSTLTLTLETF